MTQWVENQRAVPFGWEIVRDRFDPVGHDIAPFVKAQSWSTPNMVLADGRCLRTTCAAGDAGYQLDYQGDGSELIGMLGTDHRTDPWPTRWVNDRRYHGRVLIRMFCRDRQAEGFQISYPDVGEITHWVTYKGTQYASLDNVLPCAKLGTCGGWSAVGQDARSTQQSSDKRPLPNGWELVPSRFDAAANDLAPFVKLYAWSTEMMVLGNGYCLKTSMAQGNDAGYQVDPSSGGNLSRMLGAAPATGDYWVDSRRYFGRVLVRRQTASRAGVACRSPRDDFASAGQEVSAPVLRRPAAAASARAGAGSGGAQSSSDAWRDEYASYQERCLPPEKSRLQDERVAQNVAVALALCIAWLLTVIFQADHGDRPNKFLDIL